MFFNLINAISFLQFVINSHFVVLKSRSRNCADHKLKCKREKTPRVRVKDSLFQSTGYGFVVHNTSEKNRESSRNA